jgi:hypothetical protein
MALENILGCSAAGHRSRVLARLRHYDIAPAFPLPQVKVMDGPQVERVAKNIKTNGLTKFLARLEKRYYRHIMMPDLLIVLRADPEISVRRKTDEPPDSVRTRATEIWNLDWHATPAYVIDASRAKTEVLSDLKALIWSAL